MRDALASRVSDISSSPVACRVRSLALADFRNYRRATVAPTSDRVVLWGDNGAGKTNLLEAISLLAPGRGLRRAALSAIDRQAGGTWRVEALVEDRNGRCAFVTRHDVVTARRVVEVEGGPPKSPATAAVQAGVTWLTPAMDRLFTEGPGARRRFLDRLVYGIDPLHARRVAAYERSLRERSILLREGRGDASWLSALERRIGELGVAVAAARRTTIDGLNRFLAEAEAGFPRPTLAVDGELEEALARRPALAVEQAFVDALAAGREADRQQGGAGRGPHRSDLRVVHRSAETPAADASTGTQKSLLLSIIFAEARLRTVELGEAPVILLDEVLAHLDGQRRLAMLEILDGLGAQVWLTGTDRALFAAIDGRAQFLNIHQATINADE